MNPLFPTAPSFPPGFSYYPDYLAPDQETFLLGEIENTELRPFNFQGYEAKRRVSTFGYNYSFDAKTITAGKEIPSVFSFLVEKVATTAGLAPGDFRQLLITQYPAGAVINWHRDAFPFGIIAGVSLLSDCTFRLRPHDSSKRTRSSILSFPVSRRSLYLIQGEARMKWDHSIAPVTETRYSITLRTLKLQPNKNVP